MYLVWFEFSAYFANLMFIMPLETLAVEGKLVTEVFPKTGIFETHTSYLLLRLGMCFSSILSLVENRVPDIQTKVRKDRGF